MLLDDRFNQPASRWQRRPWGGFLPVSFVGGWVRKPTFNRLGLIGSFAPASRPFRYHQSDLESCHSFSYGVPQCLPTQCTGTSQAR